MTRTVFEEWDVFGIFDGPPPPPTTHLTIRQYRSLVQRIGQCLGVSDISFRFNLPLAENEKGNNDDDRGVALNACGHPPLCAHLAREDGLYAMRHPDSLPAITCDDVGKAVHGPPHVHCLFCLHERQGVHCPEALPDLRQGVLGHCMHHMQKQNECLALLEGEAVAHMGEIGWGLDLSQEEQLEKLEKMAECEGRHGCFIASAGTTACPIVVAYCALCDQLAPLATFVTVPRDAENDTNNNNEQRQNPEEGEVKEEEARSVEEAELILARLLLACELLALLMREKAQTGHVPASHVQEERYIFLATPFLFGEEKEELTDAFERGAIATYSSVILPMATVNGTPDVPRLCLMNGEATVQSLRSQLPPYQFADAVVGFVMEWPTEAATDEKVEWVLRQDGGLNVRRRLVYMEDTDEWVIARVFFHHEMASLESHSEGEVDHMYGGSLRLRRNCSISKMVPVSLLQQYALQDRCGVGDTVHCMNHDNNENKMDNSAGDMANDELAGCPYSMEARTVHFFARMMALAKAMKTVEDHVKEHESLPALEDGGHGFSGGDPTDMPEGLSPMTCGELAIVPSPSEMQLAPRPENYTAQRSRSPYGPLAVSGVCPTCHRPLNDGATDGLSLPPTEKRFTPQYFRALVQAYKQRLSICESPSLHRQKEEKETPDVLEQVRMSSRPQRRQRTNLVNEEEEGTDRLSEAKVKASEPTKGEDANAGGASGSGGYYKCYFREIQKLGNGTFGGVYLCQHVMEGVALGYFALKKIPVGDNAEYLQKVLREVRILEEVKRHPNVVEYNHSWVDIAQIADFGPPVRCLFILMEYATLGSLDSYLERHGAALPTIAVWYFFLSALAGIVHLHQKNILHRDLKPQNLLLTGAPEKPPRVLVSDFGTATLLNELSYERTGGTGTIEYMAPELFECAAENDGAYIHPHTKATDVWSLGMILHYLACNGTLPARLPNGEVVLNVEESAPYVRPPEMIELIRAMLHRNPKERPTCKELLNSTVVQTILRSFEKAKLSTDILPTAAVAAAAASASWHQKKKNHKGEPIHIAYGDCDSSTSGLQDRNAPDGNEEEILQYPHSPVVEVPLMLQYKTMELRRNTSAGTRGGNKGRKLTTVDRAVQTDYVKIVYE